MDFQSTPLRALLQQVDSLVCPPLLQHSTDDEGTKTSRRLSGLSAHPQESSGKMMAEITSEIRTLFSHSLLEQFPSLANHPQTVGDVLAVEPTVRNSRVWLAAEVGGASVAGASPTSSSPSIVAPKTSRIRQRALPRDMRPSSIATELSVNHVDMTLVILRCCAAPAIEATPGDPLGGGAAQVVERADDASCATSPTVQTGGGLVDDNEVLFLDDYDALMHKLNKAEFCTPVTATRSSEVDSARFPMAPHAPPTVSDRTTAKSATSKRRREEPCEEPSVEGAVIDLRRILKRQDQLLAGLSTKIFSNNDVTTSNVPLQSVALCLCDPFLRLLSSVLHVLVREEPLKFQRLHDVLSEAADEMRGCHDTDILPTVGAGANGLRSIVHAAVEDTSSNTAAGARFNTSFSSHSRGASPLQRPILHSEDSQQSSMKGSMSGFTADGDRFSIPPPLQRTVSDVVRRGAPLPLDTARLSPGNVSPPRSPLLFGTPGGLSPTSQGSNSLAGLPRTTTQQRRGQVGGGVSRTPCTIPKRNPELPSYMLMKRKSQPCQKNAKNNSAPRVPPPVVALTGSPDCSMAFVPPPKLSLEMASHHPTGAVTNHHQISQPMHPHDDDDRTVLFGVEDRVLFADDDDL